MTPDTTSTTDPSVEAVAVVVDEAVEADKQLSSHVWICTSTHAISKVTVIDANSPSDVLETFQVCSSHLLCIASVPGAKETDYRVDEELNKLIVEESEIKEQELLLEKKMNDKKEAQLETAEEATEDGDGLGTISFITCGEESRQTPEEPGKTCFISFVLCFVLFVARQFVLFRFQLLELN